MVQFNGAGQLHTRIVKEKNPIRKSKSSMQYGIAGSETASQGRLDSVQAEHQRDASDTMAASPYKDL